MRYNSGKREKREFLNLDILSQNYKKQAVIDGTISVTGPNINYKNCLQKNRRYVFIKDRYVFCNGVSFTKW
jgi:hypothetical protein